MRSDSAKIKISVTPLGRLSLSEEAGNTFERISVGYQRLRPRPTTFEALAVLIITFTLVAFDHWHRKHFILKLLWYIIFLALFLAAAGGLLPCAIARALAAAARGFEKEENSRRSGKFWAVPGLATTRPALPCLC